MTSHSISVWNPSGNSDSGLLSVRFDEERKLTGCTSEDGHVYFWSISGEKVGSCQVSDCDVTSLCFGPSSNLFCSSGENVFEIDVRTFKQTGRQWKIGREEINYISLNSTGTRLASADDDGRIRIAHVATTDTEPRIKAFRAKHENIVSCVEWATDQIIASASADQTIKSWRVDQQKCLRTVDISPFKNDVATSTLSKVNVSPPLIHTLAILKDGTNPRFLAVGCENGTIGLNKLDNGRISTGKTKTSVYPGSHSWGIGSITSRQNGPFWNLISGGNDQMVKFWRATPEEQNINIKLDKAVTLQYKVNDICLAEHDKVLVATEENKLCQLILH